MGWTCLIRFPFLIDDLRCFDSWKFDFVSDLRLAWTPTKPAGCQGAYPEIMKQLHVHLLDALCICSITVSTAWTHWIGMPILEIKMVSTVLGDKVRRSH